MEGSALCGVRGDVFTGALRRMVLLCGIVLCSTAVVRAQDLSVSPMSWDFGNVLVGTSEKLTFDLHSVGSSDVSVYRILLNETPDEVWPFVCPDHPTEPLWSLGPFSFDPTTWTPMPVVLAPAYPDPTGEHLFVDVIFSPTAPGDYGAYVGLRCDDTYPPPGVIAFLPLEGTGVLVPVPPAILLGALGMATAGWFSRRRKR